MNPIQAEHPWGKNRIEIADADYFKDIGIETQRFSDTVLNAVREASIAAREQLQKYSGRPPLLSKEEKLTTRFVPLPDGMRLGNHGYCKGCPKYIREINPTPLGCQLNCLYCLVVANKSVQTEMTLYEDYPAWLRGQLHANRVTRKGDQGALYYWSPKTEALSPEMVELGIAQEILNAFIDHVRNDEQRLGDSCPDTILINSKAGVEELVMPGPDGTTVLELLRQIPDNVQISSSLNYLNGNEALREALEPGARTKQSRYAFARMLQENNIQASGFLAQPIFHPFLPGKEVFEEIREEAGAERIYLDILTSNIRSLAVIIQIIGWFDKEAECTMWEDYLPQDAPKKSGGRRCISVGKQREIFEQVIKNSKAAGIERNTYCRFTQETADLPLLDYNNYDQPGCMGYVSPTPQQIRAARQTQRFSPGRD